MLIRRIHFKATVLLSILAVIVLLLLINLGQWQVRRAEQKQALLDMQFARAGLPATSVQALDFKENNLRYLPVSLQGEADCEHQILLDNQVRQGRVGYFVLTPVKLSNNTAILLNRGWVALGADRSMLPKVQLDTSVLTALGRLDHFPTVGIVLKGADQLSSGWPSVTQIINLDHVAVRLGYKVLPYQVLMNDKQEHGYERQWLMMKMGPEKHYGYAFQWFSLAVAWVTIYFVVSIKLGVNRNEYSNKEPN